MIHNHGLCLPVVEIRHASVPHQLQPTRNNKHHVRGPEALEAVSYGLYIMGGFLKRYLRIQFRSPLQLTGFVHRIRLTK